MDGNTARCDFIRAQLASARREAASDIRGHIPPSGPPGFEVRNNGVVLNFDSPGAAKLPPFLQKRLEERKLADAAAAEERKLGAAAAAAAAAPPVVLPPLKRKARRD